MFMASLVLLFDHSLKNTFLSTYWITTYVLLRLNYNSAGINITIYVQVRLLLNSVLLLA